MTRQDMFKQELADLLKKYGVAIYADSSEDGEGMSIYNHAPGDARIDIEVGFYLDWETLVSLELK